MVRFQINFIITTTIKQSLKSNLQSFSVGAMTLVDQKLRTIFTMHKPQIVRYIHELDTLRSKHAERFKINTTGILVNIT